MTMITSSKQNKMPGVNIGRDFLFAILYLLILEPYYFFKNTMFKQT
jgi:hypothetical protein